MRKRHCRWRERAVRRYAKSRLRPVLFAAAAAEAVMIAFGMGGQPVWHTWEHLEELRAPQEDAGFGERLGIRLELKEGILWFYRETIDTH